MFISLWILIPIVVLVVLGGALAGAIVCCAVSDADKFDRNCKELRAERDKANATIARTKADILRIDAEYDKFKTIKSDQISGLRLSLQEAAKHCRSVADYLDKKAAEA